MNSLNETKQHPENHPLQRKQWEAKNMQRTNNNCHHHRKGLINQQQEALVTMGILFCKGIRL